MKRTCKQCGKEFELPESEISFYKSKGLELPKRCKSCREKNKGYSSQTGQQQKTVRPSSGTGGASWNDNHNNRNRNDKSYVVVAAVAVLFILLVVFIKNKLSLPSENTLVSEQTALSNTQSVQSIPEPIKEQPTKEPEKKAEEQPQAQPQPQPDTDIPQNETVPVTVIENELDAAPETQTATYQFRKPQYLTEHFQKHGAEFPYATEEEYLLGANNVIQNPNALHKLEAEDGDDVYYVESTREFVVVSRDGYIRTYFLTSIDYYNRQ
ncbi:MAG: zinc-ribbon domain containing protein [Lachnospiraceae bacterium]|nr:zinc-ribbon domain containing protein [Lachnospiraceae bacterium]